MNPLEIQFTDKSSYLPTSWQWQFGDGSANATNPNPVHMYTNPGFYTVNLTVTNSYGSRTIQKFNYITVNPPPEFISDWSYRKLHTIAGSSSGDIMNYQVRFTVWNRTGVDNGENVYLGAKVNQDYTDLRFTGLNNAQLSYWIESVNSSAAVVWVKIPAIPTTGAQIYLYYGNPTASSVSNGDATFIFFDDFTGTTINLSKWQVLNSAGWSVTDGNLVGKDATGQIKSQMAFNGGNISVESRMVRTSASPPPNGYTILGLMKSSTAGVSLLDHPSPGYYRVDGTWYAGEWCITCKYVGTSTIIQHRSNALWDPGNPV